jgi:hypothetical protein
MGAAEPEESFKITDRRRRGDGESPPTEAQGQAAPAPRVAPSSRTGDPGRNLVGLFAMLGEYALEALDDEQPDPAVAAEVIDILITLREKTEGRRSPDESQALDEVLYALQLRYVNARPRPG